MLLHNSISTDMLMHHEPLGRRPDTLACFAQPGPAAPLAVQLPAESKGRQQQQQRRRPRRLGYRWLGAVAVAISASFTAYVLAWR